MQVILTPQPAEELYNLLQSTADIFNATPELQKEMRGTQGWINTIIGFRTADNSMGVAVVIRDGQITVKHRFPQGLNRQKAP